ncbi:hypothetical protein ACJD0Z_09335 [Flavobacteriaceae bacterium M23B6Z8]
MKKVTLFVCAFVLVISSGFTPATNEVSFEEKADRYHELSKTEYFKVLIAIPEDEFVKSTNEDELIASLKFLEGSTLEELKTIFEVEVDAYGCSWVTVSTTCSSCRSSTIFCGPFRKVKFCSKKQLEYCGSYWSGRARYPGYYQCC